MPNRAATRLHGDHLVNEVLRNLEESLFPIRGKTLVPCIYRIYLNPEDYQPLREVAPFIAAEIRMALDEQLKAWNGTRGRLAAKLLDRIGSRNLNAGQYVRLAETWTVEIQPDLDGKLAVGEIEIYSELAEPQKREYGAGSMTRRIFPNDPANRADLVAPEATAPDGLGSGGKIADPIGDSIDTARPQPAPHAYLRFADEYGPHVFEVTRNQVVIGRGGRSYWVDLKLDTLPDVSREHCRIRRNPETGGFTIEDVSQFGTFVDGKPVGQNAVMPLPPRAVIGLADVIELQWEVV